MRAETSTPVNEIIATRRSPRSLNAQAEMKSEDLMAALEAARWAPSAHNGQPWRFLVGQRGDQTFTTILNSLGEFNQLWAKNASALILVAGKTVKADGSPHGTYMYDCGLAVAQLSIEVHDRGYVAHQMTGFNKEVAEETLGLSEDLKAVVVVAIGKQDEASLLPEAMAERENAPRQRLSLEEIVLKGLPS
jgi:nitroreductase